jgi:hypothetical protein
MARTYVRNVDEICVSTAAMLGFHLLCRIGEYSANGGRTTHQLMCHQVDFELEGGLLVTAPDLRNHVMVDLIGVMITFEGDKTHAAGDMTHHYIDGTPSGSAGERWLVELLREWVILSKVQITDPFFTRYLPTGTRRVLITKDVGEYLKFAEVAFKLREGVFKGHSFRSAGASELFKQGKTDEVVNHLGRWVPGSKASIPYRFRADRTSGALTGIENVLDVGKHSFKDMKSIRRPLHPQSKAYKVDGPVTKVPLSNTPLFPLSIGGGCIVRVPAPQRSQGPVSVVLAVPGNELISGFGGKTPM